MDPDISAGTEVFDSVPALHEQLLQIISLPASKRSVILPELESRRLLIEA